MSSPLKQNTTTIQELLNKINSLPEEVILPELTNPADASKALSGYEFINEDGEKVTGTIPTKTASDLTASGATVTVPAGYYASQTTKSVTTATQATPSISIDSAGKITATATQTAGYVTAGTKSGTKQLTTQAAKTITPSTSSQTAVAKGVYTTGVVTVGAIPNTYIQPTATKAATTYTPTTSNQTIAAGTYCSGVQTIKGDANLKAENIKSGVSIFGVTGTASSGSGSGGGSVETCAVAFDFGTVYDPINEEYVGAMLDVMYIDMSSGEPILADAKHRCKQDGDVITVAKNSLVAFRPRDIGAGVMATSMEVSNDVPFVWNTINGTSFMITDNCTISVNFD